MSEESISSASCTGANFADPLPEIAENVCSRFLFDGESLLRLGETSAAWRKIVRDPTVWERLNAERFGIQVMPGPPNHPAAVPGWCFFPGMDSPGHDCASPNDANGQLSPEALAALADQRDGRAFNTNGWIKRALRPVAQWERFSYELGAGLYVRESDVVCGLGLPPLLPPSPPPPRPEPSARPPDFPGWEFYQWMDSPDHDIEHPATGEPHFRSSCTSLDELARLAAAYPGCVAFNTSGNLKRQVEPQVYWRAMGGSSSWSGLYVREDVVAARGLMRPVPGFPLHPVLRYFQRAKTRLLAARDVDVTWMNNAYLARRQDPHPHPHPDPDPDQAQGRARYAGQDRDRGSDHHHNQGPATGSSQGHNRNRIGLWGLLAGLAEQQQEEGQDGGVVGGGDATRDRFVGSGSESEEEGEAEEAGKDGQRQQQQQDAAVRRPRAVPVPYGFPLFGRWGRARQTAARGAAGRRVGAAAADGSGGGSGGGGGGGGSAGGGRGDGGGGSSGGASGAGGSGAEAPPALPVPAPRPSAVVELRNVCWLNLAGQFYGVGPGAYRCVWRLLVEPHCNISSLNFKVTLTGKRPCNPGLAAPRPPPTAAPGVRTEKSSAAVGSDLDSRVVQWRDIVRQYGGRGWFDQECAEFVAPRGTVYDVEVVLWNHDSMWKSGLMFKELVLEPTAGTTRPVPAAAASALPGGCPAAATSAASTSRSLRIGGM